MYEEDVYITYTFSAILVISPIGRKLFLMVSNECTLSVIGLMLYGINVTAKNVKWHIGNSINQRVPR